MTERAKTEGTLAAHDLAHVVQSLYENRRTGLLELTRDGVSRTLTFDQGRIVFAASSNPDDRMGVMLLRRGRLTLGEFAAASTEVSPGRRLGTVLVAMGILEPSELSDVISDHTREIACDAFLWEEGRYRFQEGPITPEVVKLGVRTPDLILGGLGRVETWSRIDGALGGVDALYARVAGAQHVVADLTLSPELRAVLAGLDPPQTVGDLCGASSLADIDVCRALWAFRVLGIARPLDAPDPRPDAPAADDDGLDMILSSE
jgi:hypothetical protein